MLATEVLPGGTGWPPRWWRGATNTLPKRSWPGATEVPPGRCWLSAPGRRRLPHSTGPCPHPAPRLEESQAVGGPLTCARVPCAVLDVSPGHHHPGALRSLHARLRHR